MKNSRAMTLTEVIFAMAIFSTTVVAMLIFFSSLAESVKLEEDISDLNRNADRVVEKMSEELRGAFIPGDAPADWVTPLNAGAANINYLVAVDHDGDGDELDASLEAEWGSVREDYSPGEFLDLSRFTDPSATTNRFYQSFNFVQTDTFQESFSNTDLNNDGDATDTFAIGRIEKNYLGGTCNNAGSVHNGVTTPTTLTQELTGSIVVQGLDGNGDGEPDLIDLDNDGNTDPIFLLNGTQLTINLFVTKMDGQTPVLKRITTTVELRNME